MMQHDTPPTLTDTTMNTTRKSKVTTIAGACALLAIVIGKAWLVLRIAAVAAL